MFSLYFNGLVLGISGICIEIFEEEPASKMSFLRLWYLLLVRRDRIWHFPSLDVPVD